MVTNCLLICLSCLAVIYAYEPSSFDDKRSDNPVMIRFGKRADASLKERRGQSGMVDPLIRFGKRSGLSGNMEPLIRFGRSGLENMEPLIRFGKRDKADMMLRQAKKRFFDIDYDMLKHPISVKNE